MADKSGIQVIARAAAILRALESARSHPSLGELAATVGLPKSTVQRIVKSLCDERLLASDPPGSGIRLGPALLRLAAATPFALERALRPFLQELCNDVQETIDLSVLQGKSAVFIDQVPGPSRLTVVSAPGKSYPLHCTANGKAMLACLTPEQRRGLLAGRLARHTAATPTDPDAIESQVADFQRRPLAVDREEHTDGICAVGTGFIDASGTPWAISVPVPSTRFEQKRGYISRRLLETRAQILRGIPECHAAPAPRRASRG